MGVAVKNRPGGRSNYIAKELAAGTPWLHVLDGDRPLGVGVDARKPTRQRSLVRLVERPQELHREARLTVV